MPIVHGFGHGVIHQGPPLQVGFKVSSLSPAIWLDASNLSSVFKERTSPTNLASADSDPVGTWNDLSGNSRNFSSTSDSKRPTIKLATHNGRSSIYFDGVNDAFLLSSSILGGISGWTIYMVRQWELPGAAAAVFAAGNNILEYVTVSAGAVTGRRSYVNASNYGSTSTLALTSEIVSLTFDGSKSTNATRLVRRTNGTQDTFTFSGTIPSTSETHTSISIGGLTDIANPFKGYILEIVVLLSAASTATTQNMERYLGNKWGISVA